MIQITATDFKANLGKYLRLVNKEDIVITKNGMDIAVLSTPKSKPSVIDGLVGIVPNDGIDLKSARKERLKRYECTV